MSEAYRFTSGPYREFRGYVFWNGKPAIIHDDATLEALKRMPEFERVQPASEPSVEAEAPEPQRTIKLTECPKCHKSFGFGAATHIKFCKA